MSAILILLTASLGMALMFLAAFILAVRGGQYDDPVTPAMRILTDEDQPDPGPTPRVPLPKENIT